MKSTCRARVEEKRKVYCFYRGQGPRRSVHLAQGCHRPGADNQSSPPWSRRSVHVESEVGEITAISVAGIMIVAATVSVTDEMGYCQGDVSSAIDHCHLEVCRQHRRDGRYYGHRDTGRSRLVTGAEIMFVFLKPCEVDETRINATR